MAGGLAGSKQPNAVAGNRCQDDDDQDDANLPAQAWVSGH